MRKGETKTKTKLQEWKIFSFSIEKDYGTALLKALGKNWRIYWPSSV
jgi:hypothetical protein